MQNIWAVAKEMETEGRAFYESLAKDSPSKELATVFTLLAEEEKKHYNLFEVLERSTPPGPLATAPIAIEIKNLFTALASNYLDNEPGLRALKDTASAYTHALSMENNSIEVYTTMLDNADKAEQKKALLQIINEEKYHAKLIQGLLELAQRPKEWLENAEFVHLDEY